MKHLFTAILVLFVYAGAAAQYTDSTLVSGKILKLDIRYDFNKAVLRPESVELLCELADQLKRNPQLRFEIAAHTDSRASTASCTRISSARAQAVVNCLIKFGVRPEQLYPKGYGETKPFRLDDGTVLTDKYIYSRPSKEEQEKYHSLNRRTEIQCVGPMQ